MKYSGFWKRFFSVAIDAIIFGFVDRVLNFLDPSSKYQSIISLGGYLLFVVYQIYFHTQWGQTLGKIAVGIKVVRMDNSSIVLREAILRSIVDIALVFIEATIIFSIYLKLEYGELIGEALTSSNFYKYFEILIFTWTCGEFLVVLFNKKRRALHDFIAGTVVVDIEKVTHLDQSQRTWF